MNKIIALLCVVLALASCKAHKQIIISQPVTQSQQAAQPTETPQIVSARTVNESIRAAQINFNTFNGKAKARLDIDGDGNDVTLNIRIQRDKKIWVSISTTILVPIEIARALITPDSITVINKLQGVYMKKPFSYIYQYAGNQVNFKTVQALLIGNALPETLDDNGNIEPAHVSDILSGTINNMVYRLTVPLGFSRVEQTILTNPQANLSLQVNNYDYIKADNRTIPSQINIVSSAGAKKINVNLHYTSAEFDKPLEYPFNIPGSYTAVD